MSGIGDWPGFYVHKPRVWRRRWSRVLLTVSPSLERREWLWTIVRSNRVGLWGLAHGRCRTRHEACMVGSLVAGNYDGLERVANHARIHASL